jgi:hypothetical protein
MNKYLKIFQFFVLALIYKFFAVSVAHAATNTIDVGYPAFVSSTSPADFVANLYTYALGISGTLAVIMIVYGGIKYLTSAGNESALGDAKDIITSAIWGILLLAGAYLVLNTINPQLVELRNPGLEALPAVVAPSAPSKPNDPSNPSFDSTCPSGLDKDLCQQMWSMEKNILGRGIGISSTGKCDDPRDKKCTSFYQFPQEGVDMLATLKLNCGCIMTVTAGTETGHNKHGLGLAVVDLRFSASLSSYIYKQIGTTKPTPNTYYDGSDGHRYFLEDDHWHVELGAATRQTN